MATRYIYFILSGLVSLFILASTVNVSAAEEEQSLGVIEFPVSCSEDVQGDMNNAVGLLHHMMYAQAEKAFQDVASKDPECAMAYWGIAMTLFHPLWAPPSKEELAKGQEAVAKAKGLKPGTPREDAYVNAVNAFYTDWDTKDHKTRIAAWSDGQNTVLLENPDDVDAGALYSLSLLATAPKKDMTFSNQKKAGAILEKLMTENPEHPGLFHYTLHAYDNPALAEKAVPVARGYDKLAPQVPHALHMPSHIFVRLGIWQDTIDWNIRSAAVAKDQSTDAMSLHYAHAADYLIYAYLQKGQDKKALEVITQLNEIDNFQDSFITAYAIAAAQVRYPIERVEWADAASLPLRTHANFDWDKYPQYEAITYYGKGLGAARNGDPASAKLAKAKLDTLYDATEANDEQYWSVIVDAQRKTVEAWIEYTSGDKEEGLKMMQAAADIEDSVDKHPVTPGSVMPARDMYGDMLLMSDKPAEALEAFEASLKTSPNRFYSLYGAGHAAELSGNQEKAEAYYSQLIQLTAEADTQREQVNKAKDYMSKEEDKS